MLASTATPLLFAALALTAEIPELKAERYVLDNGLTVLLHVDKRLPIVAASVWYDVGAYHEPKGRSGFAHLFEHMMFQASRNVPEDMHFRYLEHAGATGVNGSTGYDRTNYVETVPKNYLELALWLESDRMGYLLDAITQESLDNQREVVKNERRQSVENAPYGLMAERVMQTIYPPEHPYYGNIIGSMEDLGQASLEDVKDFFRIYYTPKNAILGLAGDFDPAEAKALIAKYFGPLSGGPKPTVASHAAPTIAQQTVLDYDEPVGTLPKLQILWMGPSTFEADTAELDLLSHVISGTKAARLDKRVVYDEPIAQSVTAYFYETRSGGRFVIDLVVSPQSTLAKAQAAVDEVLADLQTNPPTQQELVRAQNAAETAMYRSLERLGGFGGRLEKFQLYNLHLGDPNRLAWDLTRYHKVTVADLERVRAKYLTDKRLVARATPQKVARATPTKNGAGS